MINNGNVIKVLIENRANINALGYKNLIPIHHAAYNKFVKL